MNRDSILKFTYLKEIKATLNKKSWFQNQLFLFSYLLLLKLIPNS